MAAKGKNYSRNRRRVDRNTNDLYQTPYIMTKLLLDEVEDLIEPTDTILEPAAGNGAIIKVLNDFGYHNIDTCEISENKDFFDYKTKHDIIITNPPFNFSTAFICHALNLSQKYVFMLLKLDAMTGNERYKLFFKNGSPNDFKIKYYYIFTRQLELEGELRTDGKIKSGMQCYAWFCWEKNYTGDEIVRRIDIDPYIAKKSNTKQNTFLG